MKKELLFKSSHFYSAIESKQRVTVYQQDEILDEGGVIESLHKEGMSVCINRGRTYRD